MWGINLYISLFPCYSKSIQHHRINNQITAKELRIIGETGGNLGVLSKEDALNLAKEKGLDLIEIAPNANPPVAKIIAFDKFRYQQEKEERHQRKAQHAKELKQVRISARAASHDLELKLKKVNEFLKKGHQVEIDLRLIGREKYNRGWGLKKITEFLATIKSPHQITMPPKFAGRGFIAQISKK